jgi:5'-nucleotidase
LQQENAEYDNKRRELYEYYHPLEFSPTIPIEEKTKLMEEWSVPLFSFDFEDI